MSVSRRTFVRTVGAGSAGLLGLPWVAARGAEAGGSDFAYLSCLNDSDAGIEMLRFLVDRELQGWLASDRVR